MEKRPSVKGMERKAESGDGSAASELGDRYRNGEGVQQSWEIAFHWYNCGAALGDSNAQNNLGTMYLQGIACQPDKVQAIYWYRKSAEQGNADAQWNLGKRYLHGDGIGQDYLQAYEWLSKAGAQGYTEALCELGTMWQLGHGVQKNLVAAANFHLIAAEKGDSLACQNLADYKDELRDIALAGSQMASLFLCRMHNRGFGVEKSQPLTWAWILWAQKHCVPDAEAEIVDEVSQAYDFYKKCISREIREDGERALADLRKAQG